MLFEYGWVHTHFFGRQSKGSSDGAQQWRTYANRVGLPTARDSLLVNFMCKPTKHMHKHSHAHIHTRSNSFPTHMNAHAPLHTH